MTTKIYLGKKDGAPIYLSKHSWDCGWYWGFGYLGNRNIHYHFESYLQDSKTFVIDNVFDETGLSQKDWWILLDLFKQAYALKHVAEIYRYGGHMTEVIGLTDILQSPDKAKQANDDLAIILDRIWDYCISIQK